MKRLVLAVILLVFAVAGAVCIQLLVTDSTDKTITSIEKCFEVQDGSEILENAENALKIWNRKKNLLSLVLEHSAFDEAENCFSDLEYKIITGDSDVNALCKKAIDLLERISEGEKPKIENIL